MANDVVHFEVNYGGKFYMSPKKEVMYRRAKVHHIRDFLCDEVSRVVLTQILEEEICGIKVRELWYAIPGMKLDNGLVRIDSDLVALDMLTKRRSDDIMLDIYLIQKKEIGPSELKELDPLPELPSTAICRAGDEAGDECQVGVEHMRDEDVLGEEEACDGGVGNEDVEDDEPELDDDEPELGDVRASENDERELGEPELDEHELGDDEPELGDHELDEPEIRDNDPISNTGVEPRLGDLRAGENPPFNDDDDILVSDFDFDTLSEKDLDDAEDFSSLDESEEEEKHKKKFAKFTPVVNQGAEIQLVSGMVFSSVQSFREALKEFSVQRGGNYCFSHNDGQRVDAYCIKRCECATERGRRKCTCKTLNCKWRVSAKKINDDGTFQIKLLVGEHSCTWQDENPKVDSKWLADKYIDMYKDDPNWKIYAFIEDVRRKYGVQIGYHLAWVAKRRAMLNTIGNAGVEFGKIHDYAATLRHYNRGSSTYIKLDISNPEKPLFQRFYVGLTACVKGFKEGCRPIVGLDGCHLRGAYTGQVLVAVGKDGNNNIFPIAYAVVEAERRDSWEWFLGNLMEDIGDVHPTFMSDRQKGLIEALNQIVAPHKLRVCVRHLHNNFKAQWPGTTFKDMLYTAARSYTKAGFTDAMDEMKRIDESAFTYLMSQNPCTWSRHAFTVDTNADFLLNNMCETFNSTILPARDKPVISLCEWIRRYLMKRFVKKREMIQKHNGVFTPYATKLVEKAKQEASKHCRAVWGGGSSYEIDQHQRTFLVDIDKKSCSCFKWDLTGIPCAHAICCLLKKRVNIYDYINPYYSVETYLKAYGNSVYAMPGRDGYIVTCEICPEPPKTITQPGRPKKHKRHREVGEEPPSKVAKRIRVDKYVAKCSKCKQSGHNKRRCTSQIIVTEPDKVRKVPGRPKNPNTVKFGKDIRREKNMGPSQQSSIPSSSQQSESRLVN